MALLLDTQIGLERIQRECIIVLIDSLNDYIASEEAAWVQLDQDLAALREVSYEAVKLEKIDLRNFHTGHKPSLINAPIEQYPNVSALAAVSAPSTVDQDIDHTQASDLALAIEVMCKATEREAKDPEEMVDRRAKRTAEAINKVILDNRNLNGLIPDIGSPPSIRHTNVFIRKEDTSTGRLWFWQGARLQYTIRKLSIYD
jgi:hypothetical protein